MSTMTERSATAPTWQGLDQFTKLPEWLSDAIDPALFIRSLARIVPEFATGDLIVEECDIGSVRIKRDVWIGTYTLTLARSSGESAGVVALRGTILPPGCVVPLSKFGPKVAFGSEDWHVYLPDLQVALDLQPPDSALPALPILTDPEQARVMLERSIRAATPAYSDLRIATCAPKIMRYTPGSRCTILYRLSYPTGLAEGRDWPELVIAKTYKGSKGKHAYAGMRALWEAPFAKSGVALAEPLAYLPELNLLVQGPIREEQTLQQLIELAMRDRSAESTRLLHSFIRKTAAGLAGLHRSEVRFGNIRTWDDEFAEVHSVVDNIASAVPPIADAAAPLLAWLKRRAADFPADPTLTAHGTFRPGQVLIAGEEIGFIDFDSFCQAEPALDLSLFLRRTKDIALSTLDDTPGDVDHNAREMMLARAEAICDLFLDEYTTHNPVSRERIALWEALDLFTLVLHSWTKAKPERLQHAIFTLEHHLRKLGL